MKLKLKNCIILATDENGNFIVYKHEVLCIDNDKISYIGPDSEAPVCDSEKDMKGAVLMPGLVNAHCHGPMTLLRGVGSGLALQEWLETAIFPVEDKLKCWRAVPHMFPRCMIFLTIRERYYQRQA